MASPFEKRTVRLPDATIQAIERALETFPGDPLHRLSVDAARAGLEARRRGRITQPDMDVAIDATEDLKRWSGLPVRSYRPAVCSNDAVILYCHGGAFVMGEAADFDDVCRNFARKTRTQVVSVNYRLAPEHPYPAALTDVLAVLDACDASNVGIIGESAGGALALSCALMDRDRGGAKLKAALLFYPLASRAPTSIAPSLDTPIWSAADIDWAWRAYLGEAPVDLGYAVPGETADLGGLPSTLLVHGSRDALSASVSALAGRMADCACPVQEWICEGLPHAFTLFRSLPPIQAILDESAAWLRAAMATQTAALENPHDLTA